MSPPFLIRLNASHCWQNNELVLFECMHVVMWWPPRISLAFNFLDLKCKIEFSARKTYSLETHHISVYCMQWMCLCECWTNTGCARDAWQIWLGFVQWNTIYATVKIQSQLLWIFNTQIPAFSGLVIPWLLCFIWIKNMLRSIKEPNTDLF